MFCGPFAVVRRQPVKELFLNHLYSLELLSQEERDLAPAERRTLRQQFNQLAASGTESTHLGASLLARALRSAAVATRPAATHARVRRIELVPLEDDLVLVTVLMQSGGVRQVVAHEAKAVRIRPVAGWR